MMMITRTESRIEFGLGQQKAVSIDVARITGALLAAERAANGRIVHALLLLTDGGSDPVRIEGSAIELSEVHGYVIETMLSAAPADRPSAHGAWGLAKGSARYQ